MPLITITETGSIQDTPNASVSFDHGAAHAITVTPPFGDSDEEQLRWYFETHLRFPFTNQVRAAQAAASIAAYGEALFEQVLRRHPDMYGRYQTAVQHGLQALQFDIVGSPAFHQLGSVPDVDVRVYNLL